VQVLRPTHLSWPRVARSRKILKAGLSIMAQYQHLPIYKQTYDILLRTMTATKDFSRDYKYTLGQKK
jgi:hypothetical protein